MSKQTLRTRTSTHQSKKSTTHIRQYHTPRAFIRTLNSAKHTKHRTHKRCLKKKAGVLGEEARKAFTTVCDWLLNEGYFLIEDGLSKNRYFFFKEIDHQYFLFEAVHQSINDNKEEELPTKSIVKAPAINKETQQGIDIPQIVLREFYNPVDKTIKDTTAASKKIQESFQNITTHVYKNKLYKRDMPTFEIEVRALDKPICTFKIDIIQTITNNSVNNSSYITQIDNNLSTLEHPDTQAIIDFLYYKHTDFYVKFDVDDIITKPLPGIILSEIHYQNSLFSNLSQSILPSPLDLENLKHLLRSAMIFVIGRTAISKVSRSAGIDTAILTVFLAVKILIKSVAPIPDFKPLIDELSRQYVETSKEHMHANLDVYFENDLIENTKAETEAHADADADAADKAGRDTAKKQKASNLQKRKCLEITDIFVGDRTVPALNEKMSVNAVLDVINKWVCSPPNLNRILSKMFNISVGFISNIYPQTFDVRGYVNMLQVVALVKVHKDTVIRTVFQTKKKNTFASVVTVHSIAHKIIKSKKQGRSDTVGAADSQEPNNATDDAHHEQPEDTPSPPEILNDDFQLETSGLKADESGMYTLFLVLHISKSLNLSQKLVNNLLPFVDGGAIRGAIIHPDLLKVYSLGTFNSKQQDAPTKIKSPVYCTSKKIANSIKFSFKLTQHDYLLQALKEKIDSQEETIKHLQEKINPSTPTSA